MTEIPPCKSAGELFFKISSYYGVSLTDEV